MNVHSVFFYFPDEFSTITEAILDSNQMMLEKLNFTGYCLTWRTLYILRCTSTYIQNYKLRQTIGKGEKGKDKIISLRLALDLSIATKKILISQPINY